MKLGEVGRKKARATFSRKVCQLICRTAEKLLMVRMFIWELTKLRMYESKCLPHGNMLTNKCWGKWRKVRLHVRKYAISDDGDIKLAGSKESPKGNMDS
ncbi:hypothetical protein J2W91_003494 [Paenibacillus amylolyticus]|jgi:hypothetical protein|uniref:Uncharacterized protein n=1 Tax=Paenibacillus amylolyticus TaxID=1451 RepID=A0AAP5H5B3_PAEAM|nr:hypothetical protein [Paenibacillus amylolyticus]